MINNSGSSLSFRDVLLRLKHAPLRTVEEQQNAMALIDSIKGELEPMQTAMLQLEAVVKHYNLNRSMGAEEMTVADIILHRLDQSS